MMRGAAAALAIALTLVAGMPAKAGDAALGARLYHEGIGADGRPVTGTVQGDVEIGGAAFACVSCHRPSGFGTSEGGSYVPPIIGPILFAPSSPDRNRMFRELFQEVQSPSYWARVRQPRLRPAYDTASLARAVGEGVDPAGHALDPAMPRYALAEADVANLEAFLRGLSAEISPGVTRDGIHFATVIGPDADPAEAEAVLSTMQAYVEWMNGRIAVDTRNPAFSPNFRSDFIDAYRKWRLHVWRLEGSPESWEAQLAARYAEQPVFALVSGLVAGPWDAVGRFCDARRVPCLFPNAELVPEAPAERGYSMFFNRGLVLEAEVAAAEIAETLPETARIVQLHASAPRGARPAAAFTRALAARMPRVQLVSMGYDGPAALERALAGLAADGAPDALLLWTAAPEADLAVLARASVTTGALYLPSAAMAAAQATLPPGLDPALRIVWPYEEPEGYHPRQYRIRAWMHTRRLPVTHPRLQLQTYYAMTMVEFGLMHIITDFHRDYFLEIASKGAFIVAPDRSLSAGYVVLGDWIVP
ncbi:MAG: hypothetical protein CVT80_04010 [Alphaproteobacteria bacterium HGW-Alphaproteobacteria-2]|nr:MAG: hypothetical protein CVT80_04010 [Alphaproteobacteria bacterium HGW-Alphaproteobacteria-2]